MAGATIISVFLLIITIAISYKGFKDYTFFERLVFRVDKILVSKEYKRLITSGFLHVSWPHLIMNMLSLYFFSTGLELYFGPLLFLAIYFVSLLAGNLFSLFIHRNHADYSAAGASGAVSGVIFASIAVFPGMQIGLLFLPIYFPAWIYGIVFVLYSIYGIKSDKDNIGHDAHLGGALAGMLFAIALRPAALAYNYLPILLVTIPSLFFIYMIIKNPAFLYIDNFFFKKHKYHTIDEKFNLGKLVKQKQIDKILDKISKRGIDSLTKKEKQLLDDFGK